MRKIKAKTKISVIVGVALLISFIAIFLSPKFVKSQESYTEITGCTQITSPGEYRLVNNIIDSSASVCIDIHDTDNVILDCQGHVIDGAYSLGNYGYGISIYNTPGVTIRNCIIRDWYYGLSISTTQGLILTNLTIEYNYRGVELISSPYFRFVNSTIQNNNEVGISISNSYGGIIYNNLINNTNNVLFGGGKIDNNWNTTLQLGTNIIGGPYIGGNYWGSPDGTGYSDTCSDSNNDGICDNPYTLATDNIDYLPLAKVGLPTAPSYTEITGCTQITSPGEYRLVNDIIDSTASRCIDIQANDVILDCQGHIIDGVDADNSYGIFIYASWIRNVTIKNCILTDWTYGIFIREVNYNTLLNVTANSNYYGIYIYISDYNTLSNIVANSNYYGISIDVSKYDTLSNIITSYNKYGITTYSLNFSVISNIQSIFNDFGGVSIGSSEYTNVTNINVSFDGYFGVFLANSNYIILKDSVVQYSYYGIYLYSSFNNLIYNNIFNNINNIYFDVTIYTNYWNTTLQPGTNIWNSSLGYIGGNLWTTPDNNGYSDTCVDANYDGFCDDPYYLTSDGSNVDYLPIAKYVGQNVPTLSVVFNYNSVDFGTVIPNTIAEAKSINYNVTVTSSSDYKVSASATDWSGSTIISANTLYFAVNDTLDELSFATAKQLSNSVQLIATFSSSVTTNYHAFYFNVPLAPPGTYTATITITYEVV